MKVYIVVTGCHSDYKIEEVFLSKEKAMLYIAKQGFSRMRDSRIEIYETHDDKIDGEEKCGYVYHDESGHSFYYYEGDSVGE